MLHIGLFCWLSVAIATSYPYTNICQSRCQPQYFSPQICGSYCGGYWGGCAPGCRGCVPLYPRPPFATSLPVWTVPSVERPTINDPQKLVCPVDPAPRVGEISDGDDLTACQSDEDCPSAPLNLKCCKDNGIGAKVCKPAVEVHYDY